MNDIVAVRFSRNECEFMKALINMVVDDNVECAGDGSYRILDYCSRLNKRIEDALKDSDAQQ